MKAIFLIRLEEMRFVKGEEVAKALERIAESDNCMNFDKTLVLSNDYGDYYRIGLSSRYPNRDVVVVRLPDENIGIRMDESFEHGDIAVMSYNLEGLKSLSITYPQDTKDAVLDIRYKLEIFLKS